MPFYEYECSKCGYHDEMLQKITDKPLTKCPKCGKAGLKKLMSAPVFRLKGSGWYETDFKSENEKKRNLANADKEDSKGDSKSDTKADAKPDTKAESKSEAKAKPAPVKPRARKPAKAKARSARKARR